jgi:hypothetical protein
MWTPDEQKPPGGGYTGGMTDDQLARAAITGASVPVLAYLIQKIKTYLRSERDKEGRGLPERIGRRLGRLWARGYRVR